MGVGTGPACPRHNTQVAHDLQKKQKKQKKQKNSLDLRCCSVGTGPACLRHNTYPHFFNLLTISRKTGETLTGPACPRHNTTDSLQVAHDLQKKTADRPARDITQKLLPHDLQEKTRRNSGRLLVCRQDGG